MPRKALSTRTATKSPPVWLISFADMATLMLCFLILLVGYSTLSKKNIYPPSPSYKNTLKDRKDKGQKEQSLFPPLTNIMSVSFIEKVSHILAASGQSIHWRIMDKSPVLSIGSAALFHQGSAALTKTGKELLDGLVPFLIRQGQPFIIAGHTAPRQDEEGKAVSWQKFGDLSPSYALSFQRAYAVFEHFSKLSISKDIMSIKAFGEFSPEYSNYSPQGRAANRRVEIILIGQKSLLGHNPQYLNPKNNDSSLYYKGFKFGVAIPADKSSDTSNALERPLSGSQPDFPWGLHE